MASKIEHEHTDSKQTSNSKEDSYAVQPVDAKSTVPVDGLLIDVKRSSSETGAPSSESSNLEMSSTSEQPALDSPFHSPKPSLEDDMSDTTLEDGEIGEHLVEDFAASKVESEDGPDVVDTYDVKLSVSNFEEIQGM
jgi:hypothetical protein